jgi:hypothetical protein
MTLEDEQQLLSFLLLLTRNTVEPSFHETQIRGVTWRAESDPSRFNLPKARLPASIHRLWIE